jgi:hypothetical protein
LGGSFDGPHGLEGIADAEADTHGLRWNDLHRVPHYLYC